MVEQLKPTQADREAAWPIWKWASCGEANEQDFKDGLFDDHFIVQAFARHREEAIAAIRSLPDRSTRLGRYLSDKAASRALAAMEEALMEVKYRGLPDRYVSDMRLAEKVDAALKLGRIDAYHNMKMEGTLAYLECLSDHCEKELFASDFINGRADALINKEQSHD